ncbi:MAG: hypothetical protein MUP02_07885 [Actinobacteria bacterium]|nr:hypothetical protein [Actinomycetota bacterium]
MKEGILKIGDRVKDKNNDEIGEVIGIQEIAIIAFKKNVNEPAMDTNRIERKHDVAELEKI